MAFIIIAALIGLIPAFIAKNKGRSFGAWWAFGALLFIVALPAALLIKPVMVSPTGQRVPLQNTSVGLVACPSCSWQVPSARSTCPNCGVALNLRSPLRDVAGRVLGDQVQSVALPPAAVIPTPPPPSSLAQDSCSNGHPVEPGKRFCGECGALVSSLCRNGHPMNTAQKFCPECGASKSVGRALRSASTTKTARAPRSASVTKSARNASGVAKGRAATAPRKARSSAKPAPKR